MVVTHLRRRGDRMQDKLEVCIKDWAELADEYKQLELAHKEYRNVSNIM